MRYMYIMILLITCVLLSAENQLDIVWQMQGEQPSDDFGYHVIPLDFNGDGIDDLAVNADRYRGSDEYPNQRGKLYIFFGSDNGLPDTPDVTASVEIDTTFLNIIPWRKLQNLGDMNADGYEDMGYFRTKVTYDGNYHPYYYIDILLGNAVNDTIPDFSFQSNASSPEIHPLGDINGDGYDDAGITEELSNTLTYSIVYGGSFEKVTFVDGIYTRASKGFWGLGDVDGDGYDDFIYNYEEPYNEHYTFHNCFFSGGEVQETTPDYHMVSESTAGYNLKLVPAGDWNGDGYDDFAFSSYFEAGENGEPSPGCRL